LPQLVAAAVGEMWHAANMSFDLCPLLTQGAIDAIEQVWDPSDAAFGQHHLQTGMALERLAQQPIEQADLGVERHEADPDRRRRVVGGADGAGR